MDLQTAGRTLIGASQQLDETVAHMGAVSKRLEFIRTQAYGVLGSQAGTIMGRIVQLDDMASQYMQIASTLRNELRNVGLRCLAISKGDLS